ncbi:MAG: serine hydroxymethyltransferase [Candidatus Thermoplasmatota archaeon]|nr:serine hydroxymethyltransferase [Candidatus Thermoplasmatota archaeon]MCL5794120.1 serine hydroxymethyltransferase [Candidatus Thermoplasmatota archaeon]
MLGDLIDTFNSYRGSCLNLQASENSLSPNASEALSSRLSTRYSHIDAETGENSYGGSDIIEEIRVECERLACEVFRVKYAEVRPIGAHIAAEAVLLATLNKGDTFLHIGGKNGGYPGYEQAYLPDMLSLHSAEIPYLYDRQEIDFEGLQALAFSLKPAAILLGQSAFVNEYDLARISEIADAHSMLVIYDASHVMGLVAGKAFQKDATDRADVVFGSTHKSFFGPQGGIVLSNREDIMNKVRRNLTWKTMDNYHPSRLASLGIALEEMSRHGRKYASSVVSNSSALGKSLNENGLGIRFPPWYSRTHQILMDTDGLRTRGLDSVSFSRLMEKNRIILDRDGRIGTSEITRQGCDDMEYVGELIIKALGNHDVSREVSDLVSGLNTEYW